MAESLSGNLWNEVCEHYKRHCRILAPCCSNVYGCHVCHDEKENHILNRHDINKLLCVICNNIQDSLAGMKCMECGTLFGAYSCLFCFMFDDNLKGQFHCFDCGICRIGGEQNYYHCKTCNTCLALRMRNSHKCVENSTAGDCPVCTEHLHTSRKELHVPKCGHVLHTSCYNELLGQQFNECTICKTRFN